MIVTENMQVIDASRAGMSFSTIMDITQLISSLGVKPRIIVFPISPSHGFFHIDVTDKGIFGFFNKNVPEFFGSVDYKVVTNPTEYKGRYYGNYGQFSKTFFSVEKKKATCPEQIGFDHSFIEFMYWANFLHSANHVEDINRYVEQVKELRESGVQVFTLFMPVNYEDIHSLLGTSAVSLVAKEVSDVEEILRQHGLQVINVSSKVPSEDFADRWCACGHLSERGRSLVGNSISDAIAKIGKVIEVTR